MEANLEEVKGGAERRPRWITTGTHPAAPEAAVDQEVRRTTSAKPRTSVESDRRGYWALEAIVTATEQARSELCDLVKPQEDPGFDTCSPSLESSLAARGGGPTWALSDQAATDDDSGSVTDTTAGVSRCCGFATLALGVRIERTRGQGMRCC